MMSHWSCCHDDTALRVSVAPSSQTLGDEVPTWVTLVKPIGEEEGKFVDQSLGDHVFHTERFANK